MKELAKQYDPSQVEDRIYQFWLDGGYFHTKADPDKKPYTIVMPPPNVTGQLHMGHAVDNTMQDILIRTKRMQGYAALWVPGTDHASIATEAKVVAMLREKGIEKSSLSREEFLRYAWEWKEKYGGVILKQLRKLGASCDSGTAPASRWTTPAPKACCASSATSTTRARSTAACAW